MDEKRIAVTGVGVIAPNGTNVPEFWKNIRVGRSGISRIESFDVSGFQAQIAGIVKDFDPGSFGIDDDQKNNLDRYVLFALAAAEEAMCQAGLNNGGYDPTRLGISTATAIAGTKFMEEEFLRLTEGAKAPLNPNLASDNLLAGVCFNVGSSEIARKWGAQGPVITLATGCTAGLDAIGSGMDIIRSGDADIVIAGASEAPLTPIAMGAFDIIGALTSDRNETPETASRPYSVSRSGFVLAEGSGMFVLEELEHAKHRGATVLAELVGFGSTCNAYHMTDLKPEGIDLHRAMKLALADAGLQSHKIDYINSHGSSTPQNDVNETNAIKLTLGEHSYKVPVCSVKSSIGHALAAANAVEMVSLIQSIIHQETPPTTNLTEVDPACDLDYVTDGPRKTKIDFAMKDASGFSGIHSALIVARHHGVTTGGMI